MTRTQKLTMKSPTKKTNPSSPPGFMTNNPEHPFYYCIYVRNPLYCANKGDWTHKRLIMAPFIKYSADYTMVEGGADEGMEIRSCPVQIGRRVPTHIHMTPIQWQHLRQGNKQEFIINMALAQINDPKYHGEVNHYRGLSKLQDTPERLMKDAQGWVMEVMKELVTVQGQLDLCKKRLEISNAYKELDHHFHLANPVPIHPCHAPIQSPLVEAPRVVRAVVPLPSQARGVVEMLILHDADLSDRITRFYRCKMVGHIMSQYPKKRRNWKCTMCGCTHKPAKCPVKASTASPECHETTARGGTRLESVVPGVELCIAR